MSKKPLLVLTAAVVEAASGIPVSVTFWMIGVTIGLVAYGYWLRKRDEYI